MKFKISSVLFFVFIVISGITRAQLSQMQGMSQDELKKKALEMGFSEEDFLKYQQMKQMQQGSQAKQKVLRTVPDTSVILTPPPVNPMTSYKVSAFGGRNLADSLDAFGYNVFSYSPSIFLPANNLPTPTNYVFGPGDEIIFTLWGETQITQDLIVSKNGDINVPDVGIINVNGLTLGALKVKLAERLSQVYSSLKNGTTHLNVSTGQLRSVKVYVLGEVRVPGGYVLPAMSSAFTALYYAGGPSLDGSLRNVKVIRNGKTVGNLDVYDYLIKGDQSKDIRLQDEDIIFIPPAGKRVAVAGSVFRPGIYELKNGESLKDLLNYSGGLLFNAYFQIIHIERIIPFDQRKNYKNNVLSVDLNYSAVEDLRNSSYKLDDGDVVDIPGINTRPENKVQIKGDVQKPGIYELTDPGMTVRDLVVKAGNLYPDAFPDRATIIRTLPSEKREVIGFNLGKAMAGDPAENHVLQNLDEIYILKQEVFSPAKKVDISGQVKYPGSYVRQENMTLTDLIIRAGGLTDSATTKGIEISRMDTSSSTAFATEFSVNLPANYWELPKSEDVLLEDYDRILIKKDTSKTFARIVEISGEVNFPGAYTILYKGEKLKEFILRAGGLKSTSYPAGMYIKRANPVEALFQKSVVPDSIKFRNYKDQPVYDLTKFENEFSNRIPIEWDKVLADSQSIYNMELEPGDVVVIPKDPKTITVVGDINIPSTVPYKKGGSVSYYINQAGGYTETSADGDEIVLLPNGKKWESSGWFFIPNPEIKSGSVIYVPTYIKTETNYWPYVRDIISIVTTGAVLILTVHNLTK